MQLIQEFEKKFKSIIKCNFNVGDTIRIHTKIIEGEKERVQVFSGIVICMKGKGLSKTFTVYRNAYGCCMERVFLFNSPRITKVEIEKKGKVKRSKLYYLRGQAGKKAKIKEQILKKEITAKQIIPQITSEIEEKSIETKAVEEKEEIPKKKAKEKKTTEKKEKKEKK